MNSSSAGKLTCGRADEVKKIIRVAVFFGARIVLVVAAASSAIATSAAAQPAGTFTPTGKMTVPHSQHSATLLPDGRVLIAGGSSSNASVVSSAELYDPSAGTFRAAASMIAGRRMHTATLLPDDRVLLVGGYGGAGGALASAELFDPVAGTFTATGNLITARGGHSAILLASGKVLIIGGYGVNTYPYIAPAELYDPSSGTFASAGPYVGRDGCDFCAPSVLLSDGTVLFPGQYPAQLYDPAGDAFRPVGMMTREESAAAVLMNGQVLFAGGESPGRLANAELYNPTTRTFAATGSMWSRRVWHTLTLLPNGMVLAAGGETDDCQGSSCWFAGSLANAELYDASVGAFVPTGGMMAARETHTATLLKDGRVLLIGGVSYGGIGIFGGTLASAELYSPDVLAPGPALVSLSGDGQGQGVIFHAGTTYVAGPDDPAAVGESVDIYCIGLTSGSMISPQVAIGGRMAALVAVSKVPGIAGVDQVRVRVPSGIAPGSAVRVRLTYLDRPSNEVSIGVR
jgi:Galactose oxidase, central domain